MEKEKITLPVGGNRALTFEADTSKPEDRDFAKLCKEVAATKPQNIQEFFNRLHALQQKQSPEKSRKTGRKL